MSKRDAYTLLEVMIVLAIVVSLLAIAWPRMRSLAAKTQVREAAVEFKAACAEARDLAVRRGTPIVLSYRFGRSRYRIGDTARQRFDADDVIEVEAPSLTKQESVDVKPLGDQYELPTGITFDDPANRRDPTDDEFGLPGEVRISDRALTDPDSLADEDQLVIGDQDSTDWTESDSITFYPAGRSTSATVRLLALDSGESIRLTVRGLTGGVSIGPVERAPLSEADQPIEDGRELPEMEPINVSP